MKNLKTINRSFTIVQDDNKMVSILSIGIVILNIGIVILSISIVILSIAKDL